MDITMNKIIYQSISEINAALRAGKHVVVYGLHKDYGRRIIAIRPKYGTIQGKMLDDGMWVDVENMPFAIV